MATSSKFNTSNQYIKYWFDVTTNSQNVSNNTSNVTVKVKIIRTNTGYTTYGTGTVKTTINGKSFSASITPNDKITSTERTLCSYTLDIGHNSDGTKTLNMSASISHQQFSSSGTGSYSLALKAIPRTSNFSLSANSVNAGSNVTVKISSHHGSFRHKIYFKIGGATYNTVSDRPGGDTSYNIPSNVMDKITDSTSGTGTIYVETYNGSTKLGTTSKNITVNVPSNIVPTFNFNVSRVDNGVPSGWNTYVQGKSKANASITSASSPHSGRIVSYKISGGGYSSSSSSLSTGTINTSGTVRFTATVRDSRGRSVSKDFDISVSKYTNPTINSLSIARVAKSGNNYVDSDNGTYARVQLQASFTSIGTNSLSATIKYRQAGSSAWSSDTTIPTNNSAVYIGGGNISPDYSYEVIVTIRDQINVVTKNASIGTALTVLDFRNGGTGIAIGKVSERDGLEVAWPSYFTQFANFNNGLTANNNITLTSGNRFVVNGSSNNLEMGSGSSDVFFRNTTSNKYLTLNNNGNLIYDGKNVAFQSQSEALWQGYHHMSKNETVTPSKKLSQCANGWIIVWSDWNDGGKGENFNFVYSYVPKNTPWKSGQNHTFPLSAGEGDKGYTCKTLYIYDDKFTGHDTNKQGSAYDIVIRAVLEY